MKSLRERNGLTPEGYDLALQRFTSEQKERKASKRKPYKQLLAGVALTLLDINVDFGDKLDGAVGIVGVGLLAYGVYSAYKNIDESAKAYHTKFREIREKELLERLPAYKNPLEPVLGDDGQIIGYEGSISVSSDTPDDVDDTHSFSEDLQMVYSHPEGPVIGFGAFVACLLAVDESTLDSAAKKCLERYYVLLDRIFPAQGITWKEYMNSIRHIPEIVDPIRSLCSVNIETVES